MTDGEARIVSETIFGAEDLAASLPQALRPFLAVDSLPLPASIFNDVSQAFWAAARALAPVVRLRRRAYICFTTAPFRLNLANGELRYTPNPDVVHVSVEEFIFIDVNKLLGYAYPLRVASILEELVHVFMNISDETLVSIVVAQLYPDVQFVDGGYVVTP